MSKSPGPWPIVAAAAAVISAVVGGLYMMSEGILRETNLSIDLARQEGEKNRVKAQDEISDLRSTMRGRVQSYDARMLLIQGDISKIQERIGRNEQSLSDLRERLGRVSDIVMKEVTRPPFNSRGQVGPPR